MNQQFRKDVDEGLSATVKHLPSKYFYDDEGSRIFQQIMLMPEYYLTNCEFEILEQQSACIHNAFDFTQHFNIIELGAGDGSKTFQLLRYLTEQEVDFTYVPVDISTEAMDQLKAALQKQLPQLSIQPVVGDYFQVLREKTASDNSQNLLLFLGGNIGNYAYDEALQLLQLFNSVMKSNDKLLIGMDLQKNPITIHNAYYDPAGITKAFNLNLLRRINRELGGNFIIDQFDFYCHYHPGNGEVRSFLVSLEDQIVEIADLGKSYHFQKNELIGTELSKKYTFEEIEQLAQNSGFEIRKNFLDSRQYFTNTLWTKP